MPQPSSPGPSRRAWRRRAASALAGGATLIALVALLLPSATLAQLPLGPLNDLFALGQGTGQTPARVATQMPAEPEQTAAPRADCAPGTRLEPGIQGRVPANAAAQGLACNVTQIGHQGQAGGFKTLRYVDRAGHECAYYDTALLFPLNALRFDADSLGVAVLDMSDPSNPRQTATLTSPSMLSPHESLALNERRGLLAAVLGNPATAPGLVAVYDLSQDCRNPVLRSSAPLARFGHESGFSEDGRTFYATGTGAQSITAIDVADPSNPKAVWQGNVTAHGLTLSPDGNRAYAADPTAQEMVILDTSEVQARKADPQVREISRLTWRRASIPQNAIPFTSRGRPYVLEFDEYDAATLGQGNPDDVGAARIIDIGDERNPRVVSNIRLQVNQPEDHRAAEGDPGALSPAQGYGAHYCDLSSRTDPTVVACSFIASGLRVFDISDLTTPKEIAYHVGPTQARAENGLMASAYAMSKPTIVPERREVWYSDGGSGFYALRVAESAWPSAGAAATQTGTEQLLTCSDEQLLLHDVHRVGDRVRVSGVAAPSLRGRAVDLHGAWDGRRVKRLAVGDDGRFTALVRLPPRALRTGYSNRARYQARIGSLRSKSLKLQRRLEIRRARADGRRLTLGGRVLAPRTTRGDGRKVTISRFRDCRRTSRLGRATLRRDGSFAKTVTSPEGAVGSVLRVTATVRSREGRRIGRTYSLPQPFDLR